MGKARNIKSLKHLKGVCSDLTILVKRFQRDTIKYAKELPSEITKQDIETINNYQSVILDLIKEFENKNENGYKEFCQLKNMIIKYFEKIESFKVILCLRAKHYKTNVVIPQLQIIDNLFENKN